MKNLIYEKRQENLRNSLAEKKTDGMLITNMTNIKYISGFTGSAASCLITPKGNYFITDGRYIEQSKEQVVGFERFISMDPHLSQIKKNNLISKDCKLFFSRKNTTNKISENLSNQIKNKPKELKICQLDSDNISTLKFLDKLKFLVKKFLAITINRKKKRKF